MGAKFARRQRPFLTRRARRRFWIDDDERQGSVAGGIRCRFIQYFAARFVESVKLDLTTDKRR